MPEFHPANAGGLRLDTNSRVSLWSPKLLAPALWLDAADLTTITSSGGAVSQWNDKSGNNRHFVQATSTLQPSTGASVNGNNAITFNGNKVMASGSFSLAQPFAVFAAFRTLSTFASSTFSQYAIVFDNAGTGVRPILFSRNADFTNRPSIYAGTNQPSGSALSNSTSYLQVGVFDGASSQMRLNGSSLSLAGSPGTAGITSGARIGGDVTTTRPMSDICELVITSGTPSSQTISLVEAYLNAKWALY